MIKQRKKHDCRCSGHPHGSPKISRGVCYWPHGGQRPAVSERIRGKREERAWLTSASPDDEEF